MKLNKLEKKLKRSGKEVKNGIDRWMNLGRRRRRRTDSHPLALPSGQQDNRHTFFSDDITSRLHRLLLHNTLTSLNSFRYYNGGSWIQALTCRGWGWDWAEQEIRLGFAFLFKQIWVVGAADEYERSKSEVESKEEQGKKKRRHSETCLCLGVCESAVEMIETKKTKKTKTTTKKKKNRDGDEREV